MRAFPLLVLHTKVDNYDNLRNAVIERLRLRSVTTEKLVLFDIAVQTIADISRVLALPGGYVALIGLGGSGKQSLAKLAAQCCCFHIYEWKSASLNLESDIRQELYRLLSSCNLRGTRYCVLLSLIRIVHHAAKETHNA
jgi:dynein heavy chain